MATPARRHPANAPGGWFVDTTCIDCDACRQHAPDTFGAADAQSIVALQPRTPDERRRAAIALLSCPTASIGVLRPCHDGAADAADGGALPTDVLPYEVDDGVYACGYHSRHSYGGHAWLVRRDGGNLLVDSPRYVPQLVAAFERLGGVAAILLTHRDDVADYDRYAARFGARVFLHRADARGLAGVTDLLDDDDDDGAGAADPRPHVGRGILPGVRAIAIPGHTRGSVAFHVAARGLLFTGDSLYYSREAGALWASQAYCWHSWEAQLRSLERLAPLSFEHVLPGHGMRRKAPAAQNRAELRAFLDAAHAGRASERW